MPAFRRLRLSAQAEADFLGILRWTTERFGVSQLQRYHHAILAALGELQQEILPASVRDRSDILAGIKFYHVARSGRPGRHFVVFRTIEQDGESVAEVLRILHDSMDFKRHMREEGTKEYPRS